MAPGLNSTGVVTKSMIFEMKSQLKSVSIHAAFFLSVAGCLLLPSSLTAQEGQHPETAHATDGDAHGMKGTNRLTFGIGHTQLSQGKIAGTTEWAPVASWTLNYDYWLTDKWAIGLQNDWILETFFITHGDAKEIERKNPLAVVPVGLYKFANRWTAVAGVGAEFSHGHTLTMTRLGVEYGWHLPKNWEAGVAVVWDGKWNYYNSWGISFVFSKLWPKAHGH